MTAANSRCDMQGHRNYVSGQSFRVCDSYIWAEIHYLDSPTSYRECLPQHTATQHTTTTRVDSELVFLDCCANNGSRKPALRTFLIWFSIISGIALYMLVYTSF